MITAILEAMPVELRAQHRNAGCWGEYPSNGAERIRMRLDDAIARADADPEFDHVVPDTIEVGANEDDGMSLATRSIAVSCAMGERVTMVEPSEADTRELYEASQRVLFTPACGGLPQSYTFYGSRDDEWWAVRACVGKLGIDHIVLRRESDGWVAYPNRHESIEECPPTERVWDGPVASDRDTFVDLGSLDALDLAHSLIAQSRDTDATVRHKYSVELQYELTHLCEGCAEPAQGELEYWGTEPSGRAWRVHLTR